MESFPLFFIFFIFFIVLIVLFPLSLHIFSILIRSQKILEFFFI